MRSHWILALLPLAAPWPGEPAHRPDRLLFDFQDEHQLGRLVAQVEVEVGGHELVVRPSAVGLSIDPVPGWRGIRGGNERTAIELEDLLADGALELLTWSLDAAGDAPRTGTATVAQRGTIGVRRERADGTIDHLARSGEHVLALGLESGPLPAGEWRAEVVARGRARLAVEFVLERDGRGRILDVRTPRVSE